MGALKKMFNKVRLRRAGAGQGSESLTGLPAGAPVAPVDPARPATAVPGSTLGAPMTPMGGGRRRTRRQ